MLYFGGFGRIVGFIKSNGMLDFVVVNGHFFDDLLDLIDGIQVVGDNIP